MLHKAFIDYWGPLAGFGEEQINTVRDGGYYTVLLRPGLRILSWNSNFGLKKKEDFVNLESRLYNKLLSIKFCITIRNEQFSFRFKCP